MSESVDDILIKTWADYINRLGRIEEHKVDFTVKTIPNFKEKYMEILVPINIEKIGCLEMANLFFNLISYKNSKGLLIAGIMNILRSQEERPGCLEAVVCDAVEAFNTLQVVLQERIPMLRKIGYYKVAAIEEEGNCTKLTVTYDSAPDITFNKMNFISLPKCWDVPEFDIAAAYPTELH